MAIDLDWLQRGYKPEPELPMKTYKGRLIFEIDIPTKIDSRWEARWELQHAFIKLASLWKEGKIDAVDDLWVEAERLGITIKDEYN